MADINISITNKIQKLVAASTSIWNMYKIKLGNGEDKITSSNFNIFQLLRLELKQETKSHQFFFYIW